MGRKAWASLHVRPLPGRTNIVVTRHPAFAAEGALVAHSFDAAMLAACGDALRRGSDIIIMGGVDIYAQALPLADRLEITVVHMKPDGDAVFPPIDRSVWREAARQTHAAATGDDAPFDTVIYVRASA